MHASKECMNAIHAYASLACKHTYNTAAQQGAPLMLAHNTACGTVSYQSAMQGHNWYLLHLKGYEGSLCARGAHNNNNSQVFQLIVLARYLLGVPKP